MGMSARCLDIRNLEWPGIIRVQRMAADVALCVDRANTSPCVPQQECDRCRAPIGMQRIDVRSGLDLPYLPVSDVIPAGAGLSRQTSVLMDRDLPIGRNAS